MQLSSLKGGAQAASSLQKEYKFAVFIKHIIFQKFPQALDFFKGALTACKRAVKLPDGGYTLSVLALRLTAQNGETVKETASH